MQEQDYKYIRKIILIIAGSLAGLVLLGALISLTFVNIFGKISSAFVN